MISKAKARKLAKLMQTSFALEFPNNEDIIKKIIKHPKYIEAKTVAIYYPVAYEVNLLTLLNDDKVFLVPKIKENREMDFVIVNKDTMWEKNKFGISEPINGKIINSKIDLMLIPTLATNMALYRLGHGGGYYDKYLANNQEIYTIGILSANLKFDFTSESHDHKLKEVITKEG